MGNEPAGARRPGRISSSPPPPPPPPRGRDSQGVTRRGRTRAQPWLAGQQSGRGCRWSGWAVRRGSRKKFPSIFPEYPEYLRSLSRRCELMQATITGDVTRVPSASLWPQSLPPQRPKALPLRARRSGGQGPAAWRRACPQGKGQRLGCRGGGGPPRRIRRWLLCAAASDRPHRECSLTLCSLAAGAQPVKTKIKLQDGNCMV